MCVRVCIVVAVLSPTALPCYNGCQYNYKQQTIITLSGYLVIFRLLNILPYHIRNLSGCTVDIFKNALDKFMRCIPDEPLIPGYTLYRRAESNSIVDMGHFASIREDDQNRPLPAVAHSMSGCHWQENLLQLQLQLCHFCDIHKNFVKSMILCYYKEIIMNLAITKVPMDRSHQDGHFDTKIIPWDPYQWGKSTK